jgi:hypothetical protein
VFGVPEAGAQRQNVREVMKRKKRKYTRAKDVASVAQPPLPALKSRIDVLIPTEDGPAMFHVVLGDGRESFTLDVPRRLTEKLFDHAFRNSEHISGWIQSKIKVLEKSKRRKPVKRRKSAKS